MVAAMIVVGETVVVTVCPAGVVIVVVVTRLLLVRTKLELAVPTMLVQTPFERSPLQVNVLVY